MFHKMFNVRYDTTYILKRIAAQNGLLLWLYYWLFYEDGLV